MSHETKKSSGDKIEDNLFQRIGYGLGERGRAEIAEMLDRIYWLMAYLNDMEQVRPSAAQSPATPLVRLYDYVSDMALRPGNNTCREVLDAAQAQVAELAATRAEQAPRAIASGWPN